MKSSAGHRGVTTSRGPWSRSLLVYHDALVGFDALEVPFLSELSARSLAHGGPFLNLAFEQRVAVCSKTCSEQSERSGLGGGGGRALHRLPLRRWQSEAPIDTSFLLSGDGVPGERTQRLCRILVQTKLATDSRVGQPA